MAKSAKSAESGMSPEPIFDCITNAAKDLCDVPIAFIALLETQQNLSVVSRVGLNDLQCLRIDTLCSPALTRLQDLFWVGDTRLDNRFKQVPLVVDEPNVIFFASKLLVSAGGNAIGILCILDSKPRQLSQLQQSTLVHLANAAVRLTECRLPDSHNVPLAAEEQSQHTNSDAAVINTIAIADLQSTAGELAVHAAVNLNQPLMAILGYADAAESVLSETGAVEQGELKQGELRDYINKISAESIRAGELIKDLRQNITTDKKTKTLFNPKHIIRCAIELTSSEARKYEINVLVDIDNSLEDSVVIRGNELKFAQLLLNLLRNSIRSVAGDKPGFSKIILVRAEMVDNCMICSIHDNGPGLLWPVPEDETQPVHQLKETSISISICRAVVESLGGNFWKARKPEFSPGTSLFFSFPI
jgi:signal transduction histidine kinase